MRWWVRQGSNLSQVIDLTTGDSHEDRRNRDESRVNAGFGEAKSGRDSPNLRRDVPLSIGASVVAIGVAFGAVALLGHLFVAPPLDHAAGRLW